MESMQRAGFDLNDVLFVNTVWCQPSENSDIGLTPIKCCDPNVESVVAAHPRQVVVALGNEAWAAAHGLRRLSGVRAGCGQVVRCDRWDCWSVQTVHPAFVLRSQGWRPEFDTAMARAFHLLKHGEPERPQVTIIPTPDFHSVIQALALTRMSKDRRVAVDIETAAVRRAASGSKDAF